MLEHWFAGYWWILALVAYCILLVVIIRRGIWARFGPKIVLATMCVFILTIPAMHPPGSYVNAVIVVVNLLMLFKTVFRLGDGAAISSEPLSR